MTDTAKSELNAKLVLAISEALAIHLVAQRFGLDVSMAKNWLRHNRNETGQFDSMDNLMKNLDINRRRAFLTKLIDHRPDITINDIADLLIKEILAPKSTQQSKKTNHIKPSNSNSKGLLKTKHI